MAAPLEIRILGPVEAVVSGRTAAVVGPKQQALLALLALRCGRAVSVAVLVDALWGAEIPTAAHNALHHHISRLRAALGSKSIATTPAGYALVGADGVRVHPHMSGLVRADV
jgi:DNA-binding SARP family transcriptional activator